MLKKTEKKRRERERERERSTKTSTFTFDELWMKKFLRRGEFCIDSALV